MAGRVNTKFVFILSAVLVVLVGGIASVAYLSSRDAQELVARSEQYLAQGDVKLAVETLKRAVGRSKSDPQVIKKLIEALKQLPAADQVEAGSTLQLIGQAYLNMVQIDPDSEEYLREYAEQMQHTVDQVGILPGSHPLYIYQASVARLAANPQDKLARRYRGIYGLIGLNTETPEEDFNRVGDDLKWALEQDPKDTKVAYSLAQWKLHAARRLERPGGDPDKAQQLKDEAVALVKGDLDADPTNAERKLEYMLVYQQATFDASRDDPYADIRPILDDLEAQLLEDPSPPIVVRTVAQELKQVYRKDLVAEDGAGDQANSLSKNVGVRRAIALLRRAVEVYPDELTYQLMLGTELKRAGDYQGALAYIKKIKDLSTKGLYLDVLLNYSLKNSARIEYADLLITLGEQSESKEDREAKFQEAGKIITDAVASGQGEQPRILLLKGRLALARGKVREGLISIDKAADKYDTFSTEKAEALLLSARARGQQGDWGSAAERYEQILQANPKVPSIHLVLAGIYIRQQRYSDAQDHIDAVFLENPQDEQAIMQQAALYAAQGDLDKAVQTYRQVDMANRPDLAVGLARLLIQGDRKQQAAQMLRQYYKADPTNMQVLALLMYALDDADQKQQLIDGSRAAGGDAKLLASFEQQLDPELAGDPVQAIEAIVQNEPDPFQRALSSARLYARADKPKEAREALARAEALKPDDPQVIELKFNYALADGDLDQAQRIADRAAELNLDSASGGFFLAQVQSHKHDYTGAIDTLRAALEKVPINSDSWRLLGDMYVATGNDGEAISAYEKSLKQRPDNLGSIRGLASIRNRQGRYDEALKMLKFAYKQFPSNTKLRDLYLNYEGRYGDKQTALRLRRKVAEDQPHNTDNLRALAMMLAETGQSQAGLEMIRGVIETEGRTRLNLMVLANVHRLAGDADQGARVLKDYVRSLGPQAEAGDRIMLARYLLQTGDNKGAVASYQDAIKIESDRREATRELANIYFSRGGYKQALAMYRDLHSQFPEEKLIGLKLVDSLIRVKQFDEAERVLGTFDGGTAEDAQMALIVASRGEQAKAIRLITQAIDADPGKALYYYERAALMSKNPDRTDEVIQDLNTALSLNPDHLMSRRMLVAMYLRQGQKREAMRELTTMVSRHPDYAQGRMSLIQMYVAQGDMTRAKTLAREGLALTPDKPTWHSVLAGLAVKEGDVQGAIDSYTTVMQMSPSPTNMLNLATIQIDNGRSSDALALMREHAEIVNQQPLLQAVMARALYKTGKQDQARQVFTRAAERSTSFDQLLGVAVQVRKDYSLAETVSWMEGLAKPPSRVWVELALGRLEVSEGKSQAVIRRMKELEPTLSPEDTDELHMLEQIMGPALHDVGQVQEALTYYRRVLAYAPDNTSVLNNTAYLLAEDLGKTDEALPMAERAAGLDPGNAQVLDTLGWVQFKLGQTDKAQKTLESSINAGDLPANHLHLAEVLLKQGYEAEARGHLKRAIDLAEQNNESEVLQKAQELLERTGELTESFVTP